MTSQAEMERHAITSSVLLLSAAILIFDLLVPLGIAGCIPYVAVVLLSARVRAPQPRYTWAVAIGTSLLTLLGFYFSPAGGALWMVLVNRGLALFAIWVTAALAVQHREAEDALYRRNQALEQSREGIAICDLEGRIQFVNPALANMHGYVVEDLLGEGLELLHTSEQVSGELLPFIARVRARGGGLAEIDHLRRDGSCFPARVSATLLKSDRGEPRGIVAIVDDIGDELELEMQLRQVQKMESVGRLAGGVAHDFNTILGCIQGNCELLEQRASGERRLREPLEEIHRAAERGTGLTRQLLAFSRNQVLETRVLDLNELICEFEPMLRRLLTEDIEVVRAFERAEARVRADPGSLQQILMNLVVNASDAMPRGGRITLETSSVLLEEDREEAFRDLEAGPYVVLTLTDTGCGMKEEVRRRAFEPFFSTKDIDKGTGLGLSMVYGIAKQSDGGAVIESAPGRGTAVRVLLPEVFEGVEARAPAGGAAADTSGSETVLLVEDDEAFRSLLASVLEERGYRVLVAAHPAEALQLSDGHPEALDCIVTDVVMPGMNGVDMVAKLRETQRELRVLFMSGYTDDVLSERGGSVGELNFLHKPFGMEEFAGRVRSLLDADPPES
ncbi:MAG: response regulator [Deltaproteobacteria bacterium]|nr:response regulator [Deltaproteobacteria bacterium]